MNDPTMAAIIVAAAELAKAQLQPTHENRVAATRAIMLAGSRGGLAPTCLLENVEDLGQFYFPEDFMLLLPEELEKDHEI